jgi:uncharacterized protein YbcI
LDFSDEEKRALLRIFTDVVKDKNGKGPQNIYIKYFPNEINVVFQGIVSAYERHLIENFGEEAVKILKDFYERDAHLIEKKFLGKLKEGHSLCFYHLDTDFENDVFVYKMRVGAEKYIKK